ncbi:unnamed protein product [Rotaria sordida]|uniref:Uncharacterized protein n=1 Tax=Rotaria sordida TaxID=392033 RepID=A0A818ZZU9_9BILA|nr:unnamed protein product [Rotaria sordida]
MASSTYFSCILVVGLLISFGLCVAGILGIVFGAQFLKTQINKQLPLSTDSDQLDSWISSPVPIYVQFWLWECVNVDEVIQQGLKPMLIQHGPFTYLENRIKIDVHFNLNHTVTYHQPVSYTFQRNMSSNDEQLPIKMINTPIISLLALSRNLSNVTQELINLIAKVFDESLFVTHTAREWIWGYEDPLLKAAKRLPIVGQFVPDDHFGYFYRQNNSDNGIFTVFTGVSVLPYWHTSSCNQINGTDGNWFPPLTSVNKRLYLYSTEICRSIYITFEYHSSVLNIATESFSIPAEVFYNSTINPDNAGFGTLDSGVLDVSKCKQGAPIIISLPHFLYAAERYKSRIDGLIPNADIHRTVLQIEPYTGFVLNAQKRLQLNILIQYDPLFDDLKNLHDLILPALWLNQSATIDQKTANELHKKILRYFPIVHEISIAFVIFGAVSIIVIIIVGIRRSLQRIRTLAYGGLINE